MILGWKSVYDPKSGHYHYSFQPLTPGATFCNCCGAHFLDINNGDNRPFYGIAMYEGTGPDKLFPESEKTIVETKNGPVCFLIAPTTVKREIP